MLYFINETIKRAYEINHHPEMFITHNEVIVTLYTHDVNDVTEQDTRLAKYFDDIYEDITYISRF